MGRPLDGKVTPAGKLPPARVMVVGAGVAGLAAIQTANKLGAVVSGFDVRAAAAEQVESMGGRFLKVQTQESGEGQGGYAKEMSKEWFEAAEQMLKEECKNTDAIITTALIPGRPAPVLVKQHMVDAMPAGSVIVDYAASMGGNVESTVKDQVVHTDNGVTVVGYSNIPSQIAPYSSKLFSGNVTNLLKSMEDEQGAFVVDLEDEAVRSMTVVFEGETLDPYSPPPPPEPTPEEIKVAKEAADALAKKEAQR